ncbi:efflux transporter periplasmic adaptor subunit, partial [Acinetobacter baumannii]
EAVLKTARTNLRYTQVTAPISGRIGRSSITRGALVTSAQTDPLATIQKLDPMYVDLTQSSDEYMALRKQLTENGIKP